MRIYRKELDSINSYKPGKPVEEVRRELGLDKVHKLASNECPFYPAYIRKAVNREVRNINQYPESGCFYLRDSLSRHLKVRKEQIVFGNGSDEIITLSLRAFIEAGDQVLVAYPTFLIYEIQARISGAGVVRVSLEDFGYSLRNMKKKICKNTKIIFIANPDNPSGTYVNHKELESFLLSIPAGILVYLDEAYFEFAPPDFPRSLDLLKKRGNLIVSRTFSKAYGLAGCRLGYAITTPAIARVLNKVREPFNVNRFAQAAALEALKNRKFLKKVIKHTEKEKEYFYSEFKKLNLPFVKSATNFVLVKWSADTAGIYNYLLKRGVIIRELRGWGFKNCFRVTVGKSSHNRAFIKLLRQYLSNRQTGRAKG
ncbi:MAG: histidinol-phosphate transaminase [Candidatus Omnitrophica bacterium]|nr:histidinol-phosphate transaminase [Candidatus Omnitrophota bacterium]MBD3269788.1 histidinol-phosphate transaminase [Candidatus Omnitrophota bacterium]